MPISNKKLNFTILAAENLSALLSIINNEEFWANFNAINFATAFCCLAKLWVANHSADREARTTFSSSIKNSDYKQGFLIKFEALHSDFDSHGLASILHALAKLKFNYPKFIEAILQEARFKLAHFNPQGLANTLWALATLGYQDLATVKALLIEARPKFRDFNPQELANTLWALATLGYLDPAMVQALLNEARPKLAQFNPQNLANTLWALATLGYQDPAMVRALLIEVRRKLRDFNPQNLANTLWAMATLGYQDSAMVQALLIEVRLKLRHYNSQDLANTLWALATLGYQDPAMIQALVNEARPKLTFFYAQNLANTLWALTMPWIEWQRDFIRALLKNIVDSKQAFTIIDINQIKQALSFLELKAPSAEDKLFITNYKYAPYPLRHNDKSANELSKVKPKSSGLHLDVKRILDTILKPQIGITTSNEYAYGPYFLDIAVFMDMQIRLAIEVMGPSHYFNQQVRDGLIGPSLLKQYFLEKTGLAYLYIDYNAWGELSNDQAKIDYLQPKLREKLMGIKQAEQTKIKPYLPSQAHTTSKVWPAKPFALNPNAPVFQYKLKKN